MPRLLGADEGYFFSRKGDGTVPHNLGLLPGVKTFYVDEEHSKLPTNQRVLNALTELLETGDQKDEDNLWKDIGREFAGDRGIGEESQATMLAAEASRRAARLQQATSAACIAAKPRRPTGQTVSPEEQASPTLSICASRCPCKSADPAPASASSRPPYCRRRCRQS